MGASGAGTAVLFMALQALGRVPAMLNCSVGPGPVDSALITAGIETEIAARGFVEQARLQPIAALLQARVRVLWAEDLRDQVTPLDRVLAWLAARVFPLPAGTGDDPAVILFTSGSEGRPKGVVLRHANLLANCAQAAARIDFNRLDRCLASLPLFHSFGLTASFLLPLLHGAGVFFYPSPLHFRAVPETFYASNATILFGTDSFLRGYGRVADPYDFRALRYGFAGAEPLQEETRALWLDKFGVRLLVGYGTTETGPVLTMNTPMHHRTGTVGRFLPGIEWRLAPVAGLAAGGWLWVRGPNVRLGYLRFERPCELQPPAEGWYDTGELALPATIVLVAELPLLGTGKTDYPAVERLAAAADSG
ncbi:MAG: hypothetical protein EXR31_10060 [Betaproteobacteria bacterium]|nr:hypothetical protein [Betaproteobacteria bacterium]